MNNIVFGITTYNSINFFYQNTVRILAEIDKLRFSKRILISSNGIQNYEKIVDIIDNIKIRFPNLEIELINSENKGKNKALNRILDNVKDNDICFFLDDDIIISLDSILKILNTLTQFREKYGVPILVGANFKFRGEYKNYLHKVISLPFIEDSPSPPFVMGCALAFYRKDFEKYIEDENIADDGYIGNYFLMKAMKYNLQNNFTNVIKSGVVYSNTASKLSEWMAQQTRILVGVTNSYNVFDENIIPYLFDRCKWEFSVKKNLRKPIKFTFRLFVLRVLQKFILINCHFRKKTKWENILSTK